MLRCMETRVGIFWNYSYVFLIIILFGYLFSFIYGIVCS
jgi:hypothetical protein